MKKLLSIFTLVCFVSAAVVNAQQTRTERDLLGEKQIPADAYYGVQTARALENFKLSGVLINHYPGFVEAWAIVKLAAARANTEVGAMKPERLAAIEKATAAIRDGKYHDQFLVDWYQGGAGTSTNMNANEVIANIGLELTGHKKGEYQFLEPHDDLNMSQSTNDSYPTALKVAFLLRNDHLIRELQKLVTSFRMKGDAGCCTHDGGPGVPRGRRGSGRRNQTAPRY
jgi:aspartate ammonia-lyase